jgi:hypothetical protein
MNFKEGELKMKKLLVLLMVLGLVSSAQAALTLNLSSASIAVGGTTTLTIVSDNVDNWQDNLILSEDVMAWNAPVAADWGTGTASGIGNIGAIGYNAGGYHAAIDVLVASNLGTTDVVAGTQFSIVITGMNAGTIYVSLQDPTTQAEVTTNGAPLALVVTPEPMTMALLGLGGLFLRRRK